MNRIGILLPRSTYYQSIGFDLFQGLSAGLKQLGLTDVKIITENIGFGADKQQCYRSAEKLILEENVSIVIAYIGHRTAELLRPLFLAANKILLVLDAGANLPNEWPVCPNIIYHSLHNSLGARLTAKLAVANGHRNGGMVTGYYDGGYLHTYSISKAFEKAGGTIQFNHATGYKEDEFTMQPLINHLEKQPNSALLSLFSGDFVQWYFNALKNLELKQKPTVYLTPFGFEESMLDQAIHPDYKISGIAAWSRKIDTKENKLFIDTITENGKTPNLFSLLSWECATIVKRYLDLESEYKNNNSLIINELLKFEFIGPRGKTYFDHKTNTSITPLYEASIIQNVNGKCEVKLEHKIETLQADFDTLCEQRPEEGINSAWFNSYTCI